MLEKLFYFPKSIGHTQGSTTEADNIPDSLSVQNEKNPKVSSKLMNIETCHSGMGKDMTLKISNTNKILIFDTSKL